VYFGAHVSAAGGIDKTLDRAEQMRADAVQLFTQSPRMWRPTNHDPESFERFKQRRAELGIRDGAVLAHAVYLVNLASEKLFEQSCAAMQNTLDVATAIDADGVVFHVGSRLGERLEKALERCIPALLRLLDSTTDTTWLLMENSAGAGGTIGRSLDELVQLYEACDGHERLGLCLDTCHLYVSGTDVTDIEALDGLIDQLDSQIGLDRLRALHVNDAAASLGSNLDRHANILEGELGEELGVFLSHPRLQGLPAFLEVPGVNKQGPNAEEIDKARAIHERWSRTAG
jgi:deoxyribonuclease IV